MTNNQYSSQIHVHFPQIRRYSRYIRNPNFPCRIWGKPEGGPHDQAYLLAEKKIEKARRLNKKGTRKNLVPKVGRGGIEPPCAYSQTSQTNISMISAYLL